MAKSILLSSIALSFLAAFAAAAEDLPVDNIISAAIEVEEEGSTPNNDAAPVLCSQELNAYCPPNTTCCPKYRKKSSSYHQRLATDDGADGDDSPSNSIVGYSCLMSWSSRVPQGSCCMGDENENEHAHDDDNHEGSDDTAAVSKSIGSGCAIGYTCAGPLTKSSKLELKGDEDENSVLASVPHCKRDDSVHPVDKTGRPIENEHELMPRYRTCPSFSEEEISEPYGLPVPLEASAYAKESRRNEEELASVSEGSDETKAPEGTGDGQYIGQLAYFSNMGPLSTSSSEDTSSSTIHKDVTTAIVGIHGSGRDASSYLCALLAAVGDSSSSMEMEQHLTKKFELDSSEITSTLRGRRRVQDVKEGIRDLEKQDNILVIAPWFLSPADGEQLGSTSSSSLQSNLPFLQWIDDAPISHTFRYGAESIGVLIDGDEGYAMSTISSYGAMDVLLETLCDRTNYPNLERIIVAGHSAGGQFVHRWGLSSASWCFGDGDGELYYDVGSLPSVRLVAANPRSYAYLDERRYLPLSVTVAAMAEGEEEGESDASAATLSPFDKLDFRPPTGPELDECKEYNQYCWGLTVNPDLPAPYITDNIDRLKAAGNDGDIYDDGNSNANLFHRYASRDVIYLSGERDTKKLGNQICKEDGYQGPSRRERSERFYASLQVRGEEIMSNCRRDETTKTEEEDVRIDEKSRAKDKCSSRHLDVDDREVKVHDRVVVKNVGHDHALIFQSAEGRDAMFI